MGGPEEDARSLVSSNHAFFRDPEAGSTSPGWSRTTSIGFSARASDRAV